MYPTAWREERTENQRGPSSQPWVGGVGNPSHLDPEGNGGCLGLIVLGCKPCLSGQCSWAFYLFLSFGDRSHCVARADLKLIAIPQPQPSEFWDDRPVSPYEVSLGIM